MTLISHRAAIAAIMMALHDSGVDAGAAQEANAARGETVMWFVLGFAVGSLVYCIARRRADRQLILALSERCCAQSELLRKRAERVEVRA